MPSRVISPWAAVFDALIANTSKSLFLCSPFIGRGPCERITRLLRNGKRRDFSVTVLTDLSRDNMLNGATDVGAIAELCETGSRTEIRFLPNLHAKVYIADEKCAVVTSANLTDGGLHRNLEYGMYVEERNLVKQIASDMMQYASLGSRVQVPQLRRFEQVVDELNKLNAEIDRKMRFSLRREFDRKMRTAEEEVLRVRAEGMSQHATFADTIKYLLKQGPKDTKSLYAAVQQIHPDLCDDSVKLVIRGQPWSQVKWHHRVRHAQLFLKRQGRIKRKGNKWQLVD